MSTQRQPTREIYDAIEQAYRHFNQQLFGGQLPHCLVVLQRKPRMMGYVSHQRWINGDKQMVDELAINPEYFLGYPLLEVMQTLVHEQCHVWQNHFGKPSRKSYHNKEWADKMEGIGLMPSTTGRPGGKRTGQKMSDYVIYGGRFQEAFYELTQEGFTLPWLDRAAAPRPEPAAVYDYEGRPALESLPPQEAARLQDRLGLALVAPEPETAEGGDALVEGPSEEPGEALAPSPYLLAAKKPTRVKYRCVDCGNQAWGKPGMSLICGDCQVAFSEVD